MKYWNRTRSQYHKTSRGTAFMLTRQEWSFHVNQVSLLTWLTWMLHAWCPDFKTCMYMAHGMLEGASLRLQYTAVVNTGIHSEEVPSMDYTLLQFTSYKLQFCSTVSWWVHLLSICSITITSIHLTLVKWHFLHSFWRVHWCQHLSLNYMFQLELIITRFIPCTQVTAHSAVQRQMLSSVDMSETV